MSVNDATVQSLINAAMLNPGDPGDTCCGRVGNAFRDLQRQRRAPGGSLDLNLAAAEHYLFSRWMVCTGTVSAMQMRVLVVAYDAKKWIDRATGNPNATATTANPVSPPDSDVVRWGLRGVSDGNADKAQCNASADPPYWRPLEQVFGPGRGIGPY